MDHQRLVQDVARVHEMLLATAHDAWTEPHLHQLDAAIKPLLGFTDRMLLARKYRVPPLPHFPPPSAGPPPADVSHEGLLQLLTDTCGRLTAAEEDEWTEDHLQQLSTLAEELGSTADQMFDDSPYPPPWI